MLFLPLAIRLALAAIFLVAGTAKLADLRGSVQALGDFGAPRVLQPLGALLPPAELAVGIGLLFTRTAHVAAVGALVLLAVFVAGMAVNLVRGRRPACHCFGQLHVHPIGRGTLVRNLVLAAAAAWLVVAGRGRAAIDLWVFLGRLGSTGRRVATVVAAAIVFAALSALTRTSPADDAREDDEPEADWEPIAEAPTPRSRPAPAVTVASTPAASASASPARTGMGLPIGTPAPVFVLPDLDGRTYTLDELRAPAKSVLLVFSSPHCSACKALAPRLPALAARHEATMRTVVVIGASAADAGRAHDGGGTLVLVQRDTEVSDAYECTTIPAAVIVGPDGVIQSRMAVGAREIEQLIAI
ncbi:MAG TPA: MauE/DoxX family redox-associated membrane protein [Vicinamibacterales bacterium]|nr:MauE/DoxX family redox-associated membrane protein [Vicinamibacterales bacterium]